MKRLLGMVVLLSVCALLAVTALAAESGSPDEEREAVYALIAEDDEMDRYLAYDGVTVVKESILPIYVLDLAHFAETGEFLAEPFVRGDQEKMYIAKTVTADGSYGGNLRFYVEDGKAYYSGLSPSAATIAEGGVAGAYTLGSCAYLDHAEDIREQLGADGIIPESEVRYVMTDLGNGYYFLYQRKEYFSYIGYEQGPVTGAILVEVQGKMLDDARNLQNSRSERPESGDGSETGGGMTGGTYTGTSNQNGGSGSQTVGSGSQTVGGKKPEKNTGIYKYMIIAAMLILAVLIAVIRIRRKRRKN